MLGGSTNLLAQQNLCNFFSGPTTPSSKPILNAFNRSSTATWAALLRIGDAGDQDELTLPVFGCQPGQIALVLHNTDAQSVKAYIEITRPTRFSSPTTHMQTPTFAVTGDVAGDDGVGPAACRAVNQAAFRFADTFQQAASLLGAGSHVKNTVLDGRAS